MPVDIGNIESEGLGGEIVIFVIFIVEEFPLLPIKGISEG